MTAAFAAVRSAADRLEPRAAVVLGSGLGGAAADFAPAAEAAYADVPGLVPPTVHGHRGRLAVGVWAGVPAVMFAGRVHGYEGHPPDAVTALVRLAADFGVRAVLLTNAAGGIRPDLPPGSLMPIHSHLKWLGPTGWKDPPPSLLVDCDDGIPEYDERRLRVTPYSFRLTNLLADLGRREGLSSPSGVYAALTGPSYETPAEIRALAAIGADAVGMSTAREAEAAVSLGLEVAAVSCITNAAAGTAPGPIAHGDVEAVARTAVGRLTRLTAAVLAAV